MRKSKIIKVNIYKSDNQVNLDRLTDLYAKIIERKLNAISFNSGEKVIVIDKIINILRELEV